MPRYGYKRYGGRRYKRAKSRYHRFAKTHSRASKAARRYGGITLPSKYYRLRGGKSTLYKAYGLKPGAKSVPAKGPSDAEYDYGWSYPISGHLGYLGAALMKAYLTDGN